MVKLKDLEQRDETPRWFTIYAGAESLELLLARWNNEKFRAYQRKLVKQRMRGFRAAAVEDGAGEDTLKKAAARYIVLDWRPVEDEEGNPLAYTPEGGERLLQNQDIWDQVCYNAQVFEDEIEESEEGAVKNLPAVSGGASSGNTRGTASSSKKS